MSDHDELDLTTEEGRQQLRHEIATLLGSTVKVDVYELEGLRTEAALLSRVMKALPDYPHDVNAALTLFADLPPNVTPRLVRLFTPAGDDFHYQWKACIIDPEAREEWEETHDSAAIAICLCWRAYKEHMKLREVK